MSRQVEKTLVLSFTGDSVSRNQAGTVLAAWDDARNRAADGTVKSKFLPGDSAWFIVQAAADTRITRVLATDGEVVAQGALNRGQADSLRFVSADDEQRLAWIPAGGVAPTWYGRQGSGLSVRGQVVTVGAGHPCRGLLSYTARCLSYRLQTRKVTLAKGATWPIDVVIYYVEEG